MALDIQDLGVKFYSSKTRAEALSLATQKIDAEPAAICFVSDEKGNSIILNGKIFGDGASGGSNNNGAVSSVNGKVGAVVIELNDIGVSMDSNGQKLTTLADYIKADGSIISTGFKVTTTDDDGNSYNAISITKDGILIGTSFAATQDWVNRTLVNNNQNFIDNVTAGVQNKINEAEQNAKDYADSLVVSVYRVKGSVQNITELNKIENPKIGDVYNVINPGGINYVWTDNGWDALGGSSVDLSGYYTSSEIDFKLTNVLETSKTYTDNQIQPIQQSIETNNQTVAAMNIQVTTNTNAISRNTNNITANATNIAANTTNIQNLATQLTWQ